MHKQYSKCSIGIYGKDDDDINNKLHELTYVINDHFGENTIHLLVQRHTTRTSGSSITRYNIYGEEDEVFDVGDTVWCDEFQKVCEIVATQDYDGDVDDEGKSIYYPAKVTLWIVDGNTDFYETVVIDEVEHYTEQDKNESKG